MIPANPDFLFWIEIIGRNPYADVKLNYKHLLKSLKFIGGKKQGMLEKNCDSLIFTCPLNLRLTFSGIIREGRKNKRKARGKKEKRRKIQEYNICRCFEIVEMWTRDRTSKTGLCCCIAHSQFKRVTVQDMTKSRRFDQMLEIELTYGHLLILSLYL